MATVATVSGPVDVDDLGVTFMHEHVFVSSPEMRAHWPEFGNWDEAREVEVARAKLRRLRERGCRTIVDPTVAGLGRNVRAVAAAAEGTGLQVVVATGLYIFADLPLAFSLREPQTKLEMLVELFLGDIEHGIEGTPVKAGVLKCCTDARGLTDDVELVLRAVARVHRQTGVPITTHTHPATRRGLDQIRVFDDEGVDPRSVVIGHCNESADLGYLEELIGWGGFIGFDRCGKDSPTADVERQLDNLAELLRRGHAGSIVLSHDHMSFLDWLPADYVLTRPPWHPYGFVHDHLLDGLHRRGVDEAAIDQMLVGNPRDYFARRATLTGGSSSRRSRSTASAT